ncbi:MAG: hypothetical protein IT372_04130 [Polyangiaceae bacterium]|nr:hypothetical protein [Polyangiaceae bacterium]NUQ08767.1 hypothetical protein [Phycisphaerae bacterium]
MIHEVLVEDEPYETLESIARRCGRSVAEIVGDLVAQHFGASRAGAGKGLGAIEGIVDDPAAAELDHDAVIYGAAKPR